MERRLKLRGLRGLSFIFLSILALPLTGTAFASSPPGLVEGEPDLEASGSWVVVIEDGRLYQLTDLMITGANVGIIMEHLERIDFTHLEGVNYKLLLTYQDVSLGADGTIGSLLDVFLNHKLSQKKTRTAYARIPEFMGRALDDRICHVSLESCQLSYAFCVQ